jgi:hypothetical protein
MSQEIVLTSQQILNLFTEQVRQMYPHLVYADEASLKGSRSGAYSVSVKPHLSDVVNTVKGMRQLPIKHINSFTIESKKGGEFTVTCHCLS